MAPVAHYSTLVTYNEKTSLSQVRSSLRLTKKAPSIIPIASPDIFEVLKLLKND
jgi:hypothetical protein